MPGLWVGRASLHGVSERGRAQEVVRRLPDGLRDVPRFGSRARPDCTPGREKEHLLRVRQIRVERG